ncbi:hypothetical protein COCCADRAFT_6516 [Bipolaris zeicola 26-R-13]|uniref:Uncharacterized protein n=1 Tax=Cochliobolus carbonum (strain 26-R-13) TaxID=930089 RepID=W6Y0Y2_COCC2|nr:uncharacterized protein COCCADRAFT_6516 [Bipolaris zeicola 26-R-13]EUC31638.1 hypothetical protein COCCADRAFT_6516 [Bipolaris zeicola 26-R-13]
MLSLKRVLFFFSFISLCVTQKDPLKDFCRIHGHQTTIVDRRLYVDGGLVNWSPLSAESINYTSTWLRYGELDIDKDGFPQHFLLAKNDSVPSVQGGVLWSDTSNKVMYLYGGEYGNDKPEDFVLWYYDIVYDTWNRSDVKTPDIRRASWGAGATVQDKARGYYYGGWLTNASVPGYQSRTALSNMLVYDMLASSFKNQSGPDDIPRAEGVMIYLPAGDSGLLVYFGGIQFPYGNETAKALPMTDIYVYDIGNDLWYKQKASGAGVPENRRRFCAGAAWADDRSSYNIYLFGGASVGDGVGYGDVWILSLPSFTWIKFWPRKEDGGGQTYPHHSLTCDVIENSQMIIMGGSFPNGTAECDVSPNYGQHGLDLGKANAKGAKWALFNPNVTQYKVPLEIAQTIGGGATGGATMLAPTSGWEERDLQVQFQRAYTPTTRTPTRDLPTSTATSTSNSSPAKPGGSSKKTIIAGAVGGAVGGLLLLVAMVCICLCIRRRKRIEEGNRHSQPEPPLQSMTQNTSPPISPQQCSFSPQSLPSPPSYHAWPHYAPGGPDPSAVAAPQEVPNVPSPPLQEMPNVRSPVSFGTQRQSSEPCALGIDPYYSQHPPKRAETDVSPMSN